MSLLKEGDSINFQKASCTLDGCIKIYTSRVDSVASETGKLLSGLSDSRKVLYLVQILTRESNRKHEAEEGEEEEGGGNAEDQQEKKAKKRVRTLCVQTDPGPTGRSYSGERFQCNTTQEIRS